MIIFLILVLFYLIFVMNDNYTIGVRKCQKILITVKWFIIYYMKGKMLKLLSVLSTFMLVVSASDVCFCFFHQPEVPENLNRFSKIK